MNREQPNDPDSPIAHEAASWVVKHARGYTDAEQDAFTEWLAEDPAHGAEFAWQRLNWRMLDRLAAWCPHDARHPNPDVLAAHRRRRRWQPVAVAAVAAVGMISWHFWPAPALEQARVAPIERQVLADGSVVDLNRGASISVSYSTETRRVTLVHGEAHFTVARNPDRPFVVSAQGVDVQAVGTAFGVSINSDNIKVLVTEGQVRVGPAGTEELAGPVFRESPPVVDAGELATVPRGARNIPVTIEAVSGDEIEEMLAWQPRALEFTGAPLPEVVAAFNQHNSVQATVADPRLETLRLTVSFRSDNVEGFIRLLEAAFEVKVERTNEGIFLRSAR
ncbi:MAG: FecR family protein [Opitutaceae bacterium]